jgi:hypothetical protein
MIRVERIESRPANQDANQTKEKEKRETKREREREMSKEKEGDDGRAEVTRRPHDAMQMAAT